MFLDNETAQGVSSRLTEFAILASEVAGTAVERARDYAGAHPIAVKIAIGGVATLFLNNALGKNVRENEAALFRSRLNERLRILRVGNYGLHRTILSREEKNFAGADLTDKDGNSQFQPASLVNERGRFYLGAFIYQFSDEEVQTSDGALVRASGAVNFRLNDRYLREFYNYAVGSFAETFRQKVRAAIFNEIGSKRSDAVIGHQTDSCDSVESELQRTSQGVPGDDTSSGLGVTIDSVNLLVRPAASMGSPTVALPLGADDDTLVSLDTVRWITNLIKQEETVEGRNFLRQAFSELVEASRTIEVARELGASSNLIVATPDESGLTKGAAAAAHLQRKDAPSIRKFLPKAANDAA